MRFEVSGGGLVGGLGWVEGQNMRMRLTAEQEWSVMRCCAIIVTIGALFGGVETGLVLGLKVSAVLWTSFRLMLMIP